MMIIFAAIFTITLVMGALTVDVGLWLSERRAVAKAADLAALAGAQNLPDNDQLAIDNAKEWAELNGFEHDPEGSGVEVSVDLFCSNTLKHGVAGIICENTSSPDPSPCEVGDNCDSIRVTITKPGQHIFSSFFSSFFGMGEIKEGSAAMAALTFEAIANDVVIIIDRSGSMTTNYAGVPPRTRLYWAKEAARELVDGIAGGPGHSTLGDSYVEVITFGGGTADRVIAFSDDADDVRDAINGITNPLSQTDTYIAPGMTMATDDLHDHTHIGSHRVVVLLSDGRNWATGDPTSGTHCDATHQRRANTVAAIDGLLDEADAVHTIGIGDDATCGPAHDEYCPWNSCDPQELDRDLLVAIVGDSQGAYWNVKDASDLPGTFQIIAWEIAGQALTQ